jgi:twitching motility protein PilT
MMRIPGGLHPVSDVLSAAMVESMLLAVLTGEQRHWLGERGYVDTALQIEGLGRVRSNISRQREGLKGSFRLIMNPIPTLESLGLPQDLARATHQHQGLVVVAGPSGHGKTTTLAALVDLINTAKPHHILTIEDPVELVYERKKSVVSQREVGSHTRSFASALKASLREDPDVILIGELRDRETVEIALSAAETGHLVMATMSTPSAAKTLDRLIDMFPPDDQQQVRTSLAGAIRVVVSQRLVPSADGKTVVPVVELLTGVLPLAALIRDNKLYQIPSLQQRGRAYGMIRFDESLLEQVRLGRVAGEVAMQFADNKKEFAASLAALGR